MSRKFFFAKFSAGQSRMLALLSPKLIFREMLLRDVSRKFFVAKGFSYTVSSPGETPRYDGPLEPSISIVLSYRARHAPRAHAQTQVGSFRYNS